MNWKDRLEEEGKEIPLIQYKKEICAQAARLRRFTGRKKIDSLIQCAWKMRPITLKKHSAEGKFSQYSEILRKSRIKFDFTEEFLYWIDEECVLCNLDTVIGNTSPDYSLIIHHSLKQLEEKMCVSDDAASRSNRLLLGYVRNYLDRICRELRNTRTESDAKRKKFLTWFQRMEEYPSEDLEEALQRILFWNQLFWQTGHRLIGLGRMDKLLNDFTASESSFETIKSFLRILHKNYIFKSNDLPGDTGQIIVLGGLETDGSYFCNVFTTFFLQAVAQLHLPDPKIILRISLDMPEKLLEQAASSIASGNGSPLLSDDDVVIPNLLRFGYDKADAFNYVVSACWEPLAWGCALEQNNMGCIQFGRCMSDMTADEKFVLCRSYEEVCALYFSYLKKELESLKNFWNGLIWEPDPLFTFFTEGCLRKGREIHAGGAKYNNYGVLSVGLSSAVDSLLHIKEMVFEKEILTLQQTARILRENYEGKEELREELSETRGFGKDRECVIDLVNQIMNCVEESMKNYCNPFGGKVKFGLSSPAYITSGSVSGATFDGRKKGEPYATHISGQCGEAPTEIVRFASKINWMSYGGNGNVVDLILNQSFVSEDRNRFIDFLKGCLKQRFFQMQFNILSYLQLLDARDHPEKYPGLIVRVWGFSAYFAEIPREYQNQLIERAKRSEGIKG